MALEGFLEMLRTTCLPHLSALSPLLRSGQFHSAVRLGSAKYRAVSTNSILKSHTDLHLSPAVCLCQFQIPQQTLSPPLEASCPLPSKVFVRDTDGPLMTSASTCGSPHRIRNSLGAAERMEKLCLFKWLPLELFLPGCGS